MKAMVAAKGEWEMPKDRMSHRPALKAKLAFSPIAVSQSCERGWASLLPAVMGEKRSFAAVQ